MKTIEIKGGLYMAPSNYYSDEPPRFMFFGGALGPFNDYVPVVAHTIRIDMPEGFDPRPAEVAALEAQKAELQREFTAKVVQINERISKLQCITYEPAEVAA